MTKKFDIAAANTENMYNSIEQATRDTHDTQELIKLPKRKKPRKTYTQAETREILDTMETRGRKGVKLPRINVALHPDTLKYLKTMAKVRGTTITSYVNMVLEIDKKQNAAIYKQALQFAQYVDGDLDLDGES